MDLPMVSEAVAAGEGTFSTRRPLPEGTNWKSSTRAASGLRACAGTPEPPATSSRSPTSGMNRCRARTNAGFESERCHSSTPFCAGAAPPCAGILEKRAYPPGSRTLDVGVTVALPRKGEGGIWARILSEADEGKQRRAAWMQGNGSLWEKAVSGLGTSERAGPVQFAFWGWKSYRACKLERTI